MYIKNDKTTIFVSKDKDINDIPILFLHGFTGSSKSWDETRSNLNYPSIAIDLPGHGRSSFNTLDVEYNYKDFRTELFLSLKKLGIEQIHLCGYSMGGRIAISFAQKFPQLIKTLILESTTLGITRNDEKIKKLEDDVELSNSIISSIDSFIEEWSVNPLFVSQKERNINGFNKQKKIRLNHNPIQLAKSLTSFSKGTMPAFEEAFGLFDFPVFLINGSDDTKYIKLARDMMKINKKAKQFIVDDSSHNVNIENNEYFIYTLNNILRQVD